MSEKIIFEKKILSQKLDKNGNVLEEYNKETSEAVDIQDIDKHKVCVDANMMTQAILNSDFKTILIQNVGSDFPYTTGACRGETIGNIKYELKISWDEAKRKFEDFKNKISLKFLNFKEGYYDEGQKLFDKVTSSGFKIQNKKTFLKDCVNIITILKNEVSIFFCNDEELEKACKKFGIKIKFIRISPSGTKLIKDFWRLNYPKWKHQKRYRKAK